MNEIPDPTETWEGEFDPLADPEERRVLFAALDSFRCVASHHETTREREKHYEEDTKRKKE